MIAILMFAGGVVAGWLTPKVYATGRAWVAKKTGV